MKIKKTWFSTEIEITPQEFIDIERHTYPVDGVYDWLVDFLKKF